MFSFLVRQVTSARRTLNSEKSFVVEILMPMSYFLPSLISETLSDRYEGMQVLRSGLHFHMPVGTAKQKLLDGNLKYDS